MFKNLISFWKAKDFLTNILNDFNKMLEETHVMFQSVCDLLIRGQGSADLKNRIYDIDKNVNNIERAIRKRIVEHLALQPATDLPFCLVLMSVVKDAERLGDYSKNIFEVWEMLKRPLDQTLYKKFFNELDIKLLDLFTKTQQAFIDSDETAAQQVLTQERDIVRSCDQTVSKLAASSLGVNEAVCFTLLARYFKRIAAHLTNIASSVVLPISNLDFFDEKLRHEKIEAEEE